VNQTDISARIDPIPARKILPSHRSIRSRFPSLKGGRIISPESTLERDFLLICEFDINVARYEEQPVHIDYADGRDKQYYTPDVLVTYRSDILPAMRMQPLLCEIKHWSDLKAEWPAVRRKWRAGRRYAAEHGWKFSVMTEREIRTPYLNNARFLLPYRHWPLDTAQEQLLLDWMRELRSCDPRTLLAACFRNPRMQATLIPTLWRLLGYRQIWCDFSLPLTMESRIWDVDPELPGFAR